MKLKEKSLIFSIEVLWGVSSQSKSIQVLTSLWKQFDIDGRLRLVDSIYRLLSLLIRNHIVTIIALECVLVYLVIFLFYIPHTRATRAVASGGGRVWGLGGFSLREIFEKIYYKCIPLCKCVSIKLSFKT